jgi:hypothetical protein
MQMKVLIAIGEDGSFQIVNVVSSMSEAEEMARDYVANGPRYDWLAPVQFELHSRGPFGAYINIDSVYA